TATNGTVTLGSTAGLTFQLGDGTADAAMTFTGTDTSANAALAGLRFTPAPAFVGAAAFEIQSGVVDATTVTGRTRVDTDSVPIAVNPSACNARPRVRVQPAAGGGRLDVTITATPLNGGGANALAQLRFGTFQNAR